MATGTTDASWTAEFRIPLRTLRYGPAPQTWGINFFRNIQRTRERAYWAPIERVFNLGRLSSAGDLRGLQLETPRNFKLLPYTVGSANRNFTPGVTTDFAGDIGLDAKFGVTPSLNLDATINTDFAQVEVDTQQINLTRFNLRFPEKRPFFQENSALFTIGKGSELDLFFSRRIGLDENGELVPIIGGGRLSGKIGSVNVGALNMQTADIADRPGNNFTVLRASKELRNRSSVGGMFVNRSATGDLAAEGDWNRTWGADARVGVGEYFTVAGFARAHGNAWADPDGTTPSTWTPCTTTGPTKSDSSTAGPAKISIRKSASWRTSSAIGGCRSGSRRRCGRTGFANGTSASGCRTPSTRGTTTWTAA